jgi:hypothetical protein
MLIANKVDLPNKVITSEMGAEYARQNGMGFLEVSAKTDLNIAAAFRNLISSIYSAVNESKFAETREASPSVHITDAQPANKKPKKGCCK